MPKPDLTFASDALYLRPLVETDLPTTREWRNASRKWFLDSSEITEAGHRAWFESYLKRDNDVVLMAVCAKTGELLGQLAIYGIGRDERTEVFKAEFGRLLVAPSRRGFGVGTEAVKLAVKASSRAGIRELQLDVFSNNVSALRAYSRNGFVAMIDIPMGEGKVVTRMVRRDWEVWTRPEAKKIDSFWTASPMERAHRAALAKAIAPHLTGCASILEVGCGTGLMMEALGSVVRFSRRVGCDTSEAMLSIAVDRVKGAAFCVGDAFHLQFPEGEFDAVICIEVLSHLPSIRRPLLEMARVAKKAIAFTVWEELPPTWSGAIHRAVSAGEVLAVLPQAQRQERMPGSPSRLWTWRREA